jgi:UDP-2-acetamido-3-amino-2,3-dideoxy-glucuronate N-acetyltransferase
VVKNKLTNEDGMKIGVVGGGYWGENLIRVFHRLGVLDRVCDSQPARLQQLAAKYSGIRVESSFDAILNGSGIDGVVIATPAETHYSIAKAALEAGKDVFVEKPLVLRCEDAEKLMSLAESTRRILMVGHLLEYHPAITRLHELVEQGELGRVEYIYSNRLNLGKVRREENALWSFVPHEIGVIHLLLMRFPVLVPATSRTYELQLFDKKINLVNGQFVVEKPTPKIIDIALDEPLLLECQHFLDCIQTRQSPKTDGADAWRVLKVLEASQRSLNMNGEPVQLEPHRSMEFVRA